MQRVYYKQFKGGSNAVTITHVHKQVQGHPCPALVGGNIHDVWAFVDILTPLGQVDAVLETEQKHA